MRLEVLEFVQKPGLRMILDWVLFTWIAISGSVSATKNFSQLNQKVCVRVNGHLESFVGNIKIAATTFKDLARNSEILVDKSLLVKSVLESDSVISLTYPTKWGKTMNLDMLKTFFELEVDSDGKRVRLDSTWSYRYFVHGEVSFEDGHVAMWKYPPLISLHGDIVEKHLGKYPVVHVDLSSFKPVANDFEGFLQGFRIVIHEVYKKYEYLLDDLRAKITEGVVTQEEKTEVKKQLDTFKGYTRDTCNAERMTESLQFLSQLLFERFGKRVFIFIDNYDEVVRKAFLESGIRSKDSVKWLDFYSKFINNSLNKNKNLYKGVVTGILNVDSCFVASGSNRSVNFNVLHKNIQPFYGFTKSEVTQLFAQIHIPRNSIEKALQWYCGYHLGDFPETIVCNPWSIVNFANTKKLEKYWCQVEKCKIFPFMLENDDFRHFVRAIISKSAAATIDTKSLSLGRNDVISLKQLLEMNKSNVSLTNRNTSLIFGLYYATGYFSLDVDHVLFPSANTVRVKIPCQEINHCLIEELNVHYRIRFGSKICDLAKTAADGFVESLGMRQGAQSKLLKSLKNLYGKISWNMFLKTDYVMMNDLNFMILLHMKCNYGLEIGMFVKYYDERMTERNIYMTFYGKNHGMVFNYDMCLDGVLETNSTSRRAKELVQYESFFRDKNIKSIQFMFAMYDRSRNLIGALMLNEPYPLSLSKSGEGGDKTSNWWSQNFEDFYNFVEEKKKGSKEEKKKGSKEEKKKGKKEEKKKGNKEDRGVNDDDDADDDDDDDHHHYQDYDHLYQDDDDDDDDDLVRSLDDYTFS